MTKIINCEQVAQQLVAAPQDLDEVINAHLSQCTSCKRLHEKVIGFDQTIRAALDIEVPDRIHPELPALDDLDKGTNDDNVGNNIVTFAKTHANDAAKETNLRYKFRYRALAAGLVLGIGLLLGTYIGRVTAPIPEALVDHIEHEPHLLTDEWTLMPMPSVQKVLAKGGVSLNGDIGAISYANLCYFRGKKVPHIVVQSETGPVTLMLLPDTKIDAPTPFNEEGYEGYLVPVGEGSIAIVGNQKEAVMKVRDQVKNKVSWRI